MNEELTIKTQIKKAIRDAFIGKHFMKELRQYGGRHVERTESNVQHLFFGEKEILFLGDYEHPYGYISLPFRDAVELADNGIITKTLNRSEIIENVYVLEEKRGIAMTEGDIITCCGKTYEVMREADHGHPHCDLCELEEGANMDEYALQSLVCFDCCTHGVDPYGGLYLKRKEASDDIHGTKRGSNRQRS